jgi:hypothetical protein
MCVHLLGLSEFTQIHTITFLVQLHILFVKSPVSSWFHANLTTCFCHTGPSSGIYDDLCKLVILHYSRTETATSVLWEPPTFKQTTQLLQSNRQLNSHSVESAGNIYTSQFVTRLLGDPRKRYPVSAHNRYSIATRSARRLASRL